MCVCCLKTLRFVDTREGTKKKCEKIEILAAGAVFIRRGHTKYSTSKEIRFKIELHTGSRPDSKSPSREESHEMIDTEFVVSFFSRSTIRLDQIKCCIKLSKIVAYYNEFAKYTNNY